MNYVTRIVEQPEALNESKRFRDIPVELPHRKMNFAYGKFIQSTKSGIFSLNRHEIVLAIQLECVWISGVVGMR